MGEEKYFCILLGKCLHSLPPLPCLKNSGAIKMFGGKSMENCKTCKEKETHAPESVPYIVHESSVARMERQIKRLWITILTLIFLLVGSNCAWLWWNNQWDTVESWEITQENDGGYNNYVGNDGDIVNGETNNPEN